MQGAELSVFGVLRCILPLITSSERAQVVVVFSATLPEAAEELARSLLAAPVRITV